MAEWGSLRDVATNLLSGNPLAILVTALVAFLLPVLLHTILYRSTSTPTSNDFLLLGPSGSGKTSFCLLAESKSSPARKPARETHTSQNQLIVSAALPPNVTVGSNRFRSANDPTLVDSAKNRIRYRILDTPGHGKLRNSHGVAQLNSILGSKNSNSKARGVIFMVDSGALQEEHELRDAAGYLYDILLAMQRSQYANGGRSSRRPQSIPVLVAANKQDLFTALPVASVTGKLESELEKLRQSRQKGVMDAALSSDADEQEILGGGDGQGAFRFERFEEETGVKVRAFGGAVRSGNEPNDLEGIQQWEEWIGACL